MALGQTPPDCSALVDKAFLVTGTKQEIAQVPDFVLQFAKTMGAGADPTFLATFKRALAPEILSRELKKNFQQDCDEATLKDVIASMDTPLGSKMVQIELKEQGPSSAQARAGFYKELQLHPPGDKRHDLAIQVDDATEGSQMAWNMVEAIAKAVGKMGGSQPSEAEISTMQQKYQPLLRSAMLIDVLFIYRNVSDEDLAQYVAILETPAYRKFNHNLNQAIIDTFTARMVVAMNELKRNAAGAKSEKKQ
jgi:hypothetical protein